MKTLKDRLMSTLAAAVILASNSAIALPFVLPQRAFAATAITPSSMGSWSPVTTTGGTVSFTAVAGAPSGAGAAKLVTINDNDSRARLTTNEFSGTALADVTEASYWSKVDAASNAAGSVSYSINVDTDGDLSTTADRTSLNHEPYWQNAGSPDPAPVVHGTWQEWDVAAGLFWSSATVSGFAAGAGGPPLYTLAEAKALAPAAKVVSVSVYIGSYNPSYVTYVDLVSFNGTEYNFEADPYLPTPPPTKPAVAGDVIFDSIPNVLPSNSSSLGYQATATRALGDKISFAGTSRNLLSGAVTLSSWACQSGAWNTSCTTTPGATFSHPITLHIYNTGAGDSVGSLVASRTQTFNIPYRPTADPTCATVTAWRDTNGNCFNGLNHVVVFDLSGITVPDSVIYSVEYNTQTYGPTPIGSDGPYSSLNVSLNAAAPTVGTNVSADQIYWDSTYLGRPAGLSADNGWTANGNPAVLFTAQAPDTTPPAVPTNLSWTPNGGSAMASGGATNVQQGVLNWLDSDTDVDHYKYYFWTNIPGYFEGQASAWSTEGSAYITQSPTGGSIWTDFYDKAGTYYFCVKAIDAAGNTSDCSDTFSVTYDITAPDMPIHVSPAPNANINYNDFYFQWTDVAGAAEYEFQSSQNPSVDGNGALNSGVWNNKLHGAPDRNNLTISEIHSYGANGTWYWQVRARDTAGNWSNWTSPWKLTIDMVAPQVLGITYNEVPSNDQKISGDTTYLQDFKFTLTSSSDTTRYQLKYWNDIVGSPFKVGSPWNPGNDSWDGHMTSLGDYLDLFTQGYGVHYFSFSACDAAGNCSAFSTPFEITYTEEDEGEEEVPQLPAAPQTLGWAISEQAPVCDITTSATLVAPTWTAVEGASYYIYSYKAPGGNWIVDGTQYTDLTTGNTAFGTVEGIPGLWEFRVQAVFVNGDIVTASDWSTPCGITFEPEEEGGVTLGASTDTPSTVTDVLGRGNGGQVLGASTEGLATTGTHTTGIAALAAATMLGLALVVVRRKQEN